MTDSLHSPLGFTVSPRALNMDSLTHPKCGDIGRSLPDCSLVMSPIDDKM
jgi:hypothetical protein